MAPGLDENVHSWDGDIGDPLGDVLLGRSSDVICAALSAERLRLASRSVDGMVLCGTPRPGSAVRRIAAHRFSVACVALFANVNHVASGSWDEKIRVWIL